MKKLSTILIAVMVIALVGVTMASAENMLITGEVTDKVEALDKNDQPYTRFIVKWETEIDGVKFDDEHVVMAFGAGKIAEFSSIEIGSTLKAIADYRKLNDGRTSYTLKKLLQ